MQINPNQNIQLAALIADTTDTNTYYVRCVMRDTATNKTLGSVNLTRDSSNSRRFYGHIQAPSQTGPGGRFIDITTTIYTDSGYTTPSPNYAETIEKYLVAYIWNQAIGGAGSGDPFAESYEKDGTRKLIRDEFAYVIEEIGKINSPTVVVEGKTVKRPGVDTAALVRRMEETVAAALAKKGPKMPNLKDTFDPLREDMKKAIAAAEAVSKIGEDLSKFTGLLDSLNELRERFEYLWEHVYMKEMTGDGFPLPPESSQEPRSPSKGVLPVSEVIKRHTERQAGIFGPAPAPAEPEYSSGLPPVQGDFEIPSSKRQPSEGVIPNHVRANNARALSLMPTA